jgi:hypothetical protein
MPKGYLRGRGPPAFPRELADAIAQALAAVEQARST